MTPAQLKLFAAQLRNGDQRTVNRVLNALEANAGNVTKAAAALGVSRNTLTQWRDAENPRRIPALIPVTPGAAGRRAVADYYALTYVDPPLGYEHHDTRDAAIEAARQEAGAELTCDRNGRMTDAAGKLRALVKPRVGVRTG